MQTHCQIEQRSTKGDNENENENTSSYQLISNDILPRKYSPTKSNRGRGRGNRRPRGRGRGRGRGRAIIGAPIKKQNDNKFDKMNETKDGSTKETEKCNRQC